MQKSYVYIDPQSYQNLAIYDHSLLSHIDGDIHYVCSKLYNYKTLPSNVRQHRLFSYSKYQHKPIKAISYIFSCLMLAIRLLWWRPTIIHIQWFRIPAFDSRFYILLKKILGCRIVFTAHNIVPHDTGRRYYPYFDSFYRQIDAIIVHTEATKQELFASFNLPEDKVAVIEHGLLNIQYDPQLLEKQKAEFDNHYQLKGKMVFSALGYQYEYKGVDTLVQVWASTPELCQNSQCKLLLIGKNRGVDLSAASNICNVMIEDRIASDEEFFYLLSNTDVYLLPYKQISQSGALLTVINTDTPVLVTNIGGLTDPFKIASIGWQMPQLSEETLRNQLLWLLKHPEEIKKIKENKEDWNKLRKYYSWERIGLLTQQLYDNVSSV